MNKADDLYSAAVFGVPNVTNKESFCQLSTVVRPVSCKVD